MTWAEENSVSQLETCKKCGRLVSGECYACSYNKTKCTICERLISQMETYSEGECPQCHELRYVEDGTAPDFVAAISV